MARRRNAVLTALFTYGQSAVGMVLGLVATRIVLEVLGGDMWGLWVASSSLLSYAGLAELGLFGVLPWVIADADGRKDPDRVRASLSHGLTFAVAAGLGFLLIALVLWQLYPTLLQISAHDQSELRGPVLVFSIVSAVSIPLRVFTALLMGLQDVTFLGVIGLGQIIGISLLTVVLAWCGFGLYSLALGVSLPPALSAAACLLRAGTSFRSLLRGWPSPSRQPLQALAFEGLGSWLSTIGFQLSVAADPALLANAGLLSLVTSFALTSRLPTVLTTFGCVLPNATLIGLAQLNASADRARVRDVVLAVLQLNMVAAGAIASAVLASNAGIVRVWVGADLFLGAWQNALLALNAVLLITGYGLVTVASVLGRRMAVGLTFVANGVLHVLFAFVLGRHIGVYGVIVATLLCSLLTTLPVGFHLFAATTGVTPREVLVRVCWPWLRRFAPLGLLSFWLGRFGATLHVGLLALCCGALGVGYLFWMKPLYVGLPLGPRLTRWMKAVRLLH